MATQLPVVFYCLFTANQYSCNQPKSDCQKVRGCHASTPKDILFSGIFSYYQSLIFHYCSATHDFLGSVRSLQQDCFPTFSRTLGYTHFLLHFQNTHTPPQAFRRRKGLYNSFFVMKLSVLLPTHCIFLQKCKLMTQHPPLPSVPSSLNRRIVVNSIQTEGLTSKPKACYSLQIFHASPREKSLPFGFCNQHPSYLYPTTTPFSVLAS